MSIYEDPLQPKILGARSFDQDGVAKQKQFFIENGRVASYIMSQYSANQLGLETTANSGGASNCQVSTTFDGVLDDLIKEMHKGLLVTDLMGHGINTTTGDYSRGAQGFWVDHGKIQYPVSGITIAGNLKTMLNNISAVASDIDPRSNIKVGSTLISEMTIAGEV
jgi:PmbA protein